MDVIIIILNLLVIAGIVILGLFIKSYLPSYMDQKGRNLAQKEDVQEITKKIEAVRSEHAAEIEKLKADLTLTIQNELLVQEQERDALLHFFEHCQTLLVDKLQINPGDFPIDGGKSLHEHGVSVRKLCVSIYTDYHRLFLYFSGTDKVLQKAAEVVGGVRMIQMVFKKHFGKVTTALVEEGHTLLSKGDDAKAKEIIKNSNEIVKAFWDDVNEGINVMSQAFGNYLEELNKYFKRRGRITGLESLYNTTDST